MKKQIITSLCVSVFLIVFNAVYTFFGFGEYSLHMRYMFIFPFVGGAVIPAVLTLIGHSDYIDRACFNLWNAAIATFVVGCTVQGVINISGRYTDYGKVYFVIGTVGAVISFVLYIRGVVFVSRSKK